MAFSFCQQNLFFDGCKVPQSDVPGLAARQPGFAACVWIKFSALAFKISWCSYFSQLFDVHVYMYIDVAHFSQSHRQNWELDRREEKGLSTSLPLFFDMFDGEQTVGMNRYVTRTDWKIQVSFAGRNVFFAIWCETAWCLVRPPSHDAQIIRDSMQDVKRLRYLMFRKIVGAEMTRVGRFRSTL